MKSNFQIYHSSAGSGKTYTLSLSFIALALQGNNFGYNNYYRRILAVTFTNKAATEMKERVLKYLNALSLKKDVDGILKWLLDNTQLDKDEIFNRSKDVHLHILHNYSDLAISTIDKFTYKIVRTFALDLGLSQNFELEMDNKKIIQPVVALLLNKISDSGGDLSSTLVNFALQKVEDGKSGNIENDLEEFSEQLFKENAQNYIANKSNLSSYKKIREKLYIEKNNLSSKIKELSKDVSIFFDKHNLTKDCFKSGIFYNHFILKLVDKDDSKWRPTASLLQNISNDIWYAKSTREEHKDLVESTKHHLINFFDKLMTLLTHYYSVKAVLKNIYSTALLSELTNEMISFKKENNIEHISEFNKKIHQIVIQQPSSFIYERIGERYNHYLIDEFQDTSLLQWQNILPLVTDSLDIGKTMIVGDGKQSIYRWRGGEVQQFSKLPEIYKGENLKYINDWQKKINSHYASLNLIENYRSRKNIVEFNNIFFKNVKDILSDDFRSIYDHVEQKTSKAGEGGYVHLELFGDKENDFKQLILDKMVDEIQNLTTLHNYNFKNITILCNSRKSVSLVAEYFSKNGIPVISNEGLLLANSEEIKTIIAILQYLKEKQNTIAKVVIAEYLFYNNSTTSKLSEVHQQIKSNKGFLEFLNQFNVYLNPIKILQFTLYEIVEQVLSVFKIKNDVYIDFFLDAVLSFSEKNGSCITSFLSWWEDRVEKESIVVPEDNNAVEVMTIHKSKGLSFDIVMIPFNWEDRKKTNEIWVNTSNYFDSQLQTALINSSNQLELSYFKENYQLEKEKTLLDSLNKLYVAMTRPVERLYIFSKYLPKNLKQYEKKENLNSFLYKFSDKFPVIKGDYNMNYHSNKKFKNKFKISDKDKLKWRDIISVKHSSNDIWDLEDVKKKKDWGKLLHLTLSKINYFEDKKTALKSLYDLGFITKEDQKKLEETIDSILSHEKIYPYFTKEWEIKNEQEILLENGETYIPDRIAFSKTFDKVVIIDYKSGSYSVDDEKQVVDYAKTLSLMGYKNIEKMLIYTSENINIVNL
ncbi:MAG: UvrD-helicase domain-containing protein [Bacteroidota bacterium]|nr:UvrD-helicase domain-containing protein [Bacteroidota bacterium]